MSKLVDAKNFLSYRGLALDRMDMTNIEELQEDLSQRVEKVTMVALTEKTY